ncbi:MAG TPA: chromosomal replication initiator protein DnaA [Chloroflexi bacterium]|nr:chromosomal replication initiator protein DnaA [Chloroflexota bacterium]
MRTLDLKRTWDAALGDIQLQMTRATFDTWMKGTELAGLEDGVFVISTPSPYAVEWLANRLHRTIKQTLERHVGRSVALQFVVRSPHQSRSDDPPVRPVSVPPLTAERDTRLAAPPGDDPAGPPGNGHAMPARNEHLAADDAVSHPLQARYTFDTFIVGPSNRLAHAAALAVAERPAIAYNPLFIYGGVGLGKTHLLHAIAHEAFGKSLRPVYVSSERFTNDFIADIRSQNTEAFRARYRNVDVLLIDDIQFLAGKESTQEEFFHTFNSLHAANKQIVISSDRPPKAIMLLEDRLRSRFEGGLVCDIAPPDLETRIAILHAKAETQPLPVSPAVIELIAHRVQSNIRELEGALIRVVAHAQFGGQPLTLELAERVLREILDRPEGVELDTVLREVAHFYNVGVEDLRGPSRRKAIAYARQVAMYLSREETDASLAQVGEALGGRDHSTVLYGFEKMKESVEGDDQLRRELLAIRERLYQTRE